MCVCVCERKLSKYISPLLDLFCVSYINNLNINREPNKKWIWYNEPLCHHHKNRSHILCGKSIKTKFNTIMSDHH